MAAELLLLPDTVRQLDDMARSMMNYVSEFVKQNDELQQFLSYAEQFANVQSAPTICNEHARGRRSAQEDTSIARRFEDMTLYGVCDGFGGSLISKACRDDLPRFIFAALKRWPHRAIPELIDQAFSAFDAWLVLRFGQDALFTGCTACLALLTDHDRMLHLITLGDSRIVLAGTSAADEASPQYLTSTVDQSFGDAEERERAIRAGYQVIKDKGHHYRIRKRDLLPNRALAVPRAFGAFFFKSDSSRPYRSANAGVSVKPVIQTINLIGGWPLIQTFYIIATCDGIWADMLFGPGPPPSAAEQARVRLLSEANRKPTLAVVMQYEEQLDFEAPVLNNWCVGTILDAYVRGHSDDNLSVLIAAVRPLPQLDVPRAAQSQEEEEEERKTVEQVRSLPVEEPIPDTVPLGEQPVRVEEEEEEDSDKTEPDDEDEGGDDEEETDEPVPAPRVRKRMTVSPAMLAERKRRRDLEEAKEAQEEEKRQVEAKRQRQAQREQNLDANQVLEELD